jgi:hypothetical protein
MAVKKQKKEATTSTESKEKISFDESSMLDKESNVKVKDVTNTPEEPTMSVSTVEEMLKRQEERWTNRFNSLTEKFKFNKSKAEIEEGAEYIDDLEDDWLEVPVVFFAYSFEFSIHGDKKMGKESAPPHGVVKFKPVIRTKRQGRRGEEVISVSSVKIQSKAVAEYLRNHSQFGIAFFENMDSVLNMNTDWAQRLIEANQSIQRLSDQQIISRCRQEGITIGTDISKMRKTLVEKIAKKSIKHQEDMIYGKLKKSNISADNKSGVPRELIERKLS